MLILSAIFCCSLTGTFRRLATFASFLCLHRIALYYHVLRRTCPAAVLFPTISEAYITKPAVAG